MNASKTLIAAIAAATIVGTVGFVSAQTSTEPATQGAEPMTNQTGTPQGMQQPSAAPDAAAAPSTAPADMSSPPYVAPSSDAPTPAVDTAPTPSADTPTSAATEPQPKADRN